MAEFNIPKLTESQIRKLATTPVFERGMRYFNEEAIINPILDDNELRAECVGSRYEPYELNIIFNKGEISSMDCSCPYDDGGTCKHLIALLLTYAKTPKEIRQLSIDSMLAKSSKEELILIIKQLVKRNPTLLNVVDIVTSGFANEEVFNAAAFREQVRRVMNNDSLNQVIKELAWFCKMADQLCKNSDWLNAGIRYQAIFDESISCYEDDIQEIDDDGDFCTFIDSVAVGLMACLNNYHDDPEIRKSWIESLLKSFLTDLELGGIDLAPTATEAILKFANEQEWAWVESRVRDEIRISSNFEKECLIDFLVEGMEQRKRNTDADQLIRDLGTVEQQAYLLISKNNFSEALNLVTEIVGGKPGLRIPFADAFLAAGAKQQALALVIERGTLLWNDLDWLAKYYRKYGTSQEAIDAQIALFQHSPVIENYKALCEFAKKLCDWEKVRADILWLLDTGKQNGLLIEIALYEGDITKALSLLPNTQTGRASFSYRDYRSEVALAAEKNFPQAANNLYRELAECSIADRSRDSYNMAADYLKRAKKLSNKPDGEKEWQEYMQNLRARYSQLRALQDELNKAKL